jgi:integrase
MTPHNDIHDYKLQYRKLQERIDGSNISQRNKQLIKKFEIQCRIEGLGIPRKLKILGTLLLFVINHLKKDFDRAAKNDLKKAILEIDSRNDISVWTKHSYKVIVKKFYRWLIYGDDYRDKPDYPEIISWLRTGVKKKDQPRVQASDILTEQEIEKLIEVAEHPRDKAFISLLYELGARISEIGNLKIKDITRDKYSYIIDISGKTGHRTPRIIESDPYLTTWLNMYPMKNNPDAPLWITIGARQGERMKYSAFRALVLRLARKAKLKKRIYPHLFRHTRVTHLLSNKQMNESQCKVYFGWQSSSTMLSEYSHLVSADVNDTLLRMHGLTKSDEEPKKKIKQCPRCKTINTKTDIFCRKCGSILDVKTAIKLEEKREKKDNGLAEVFSLDKELTNKLLKTIIKHKGQEWLKNFLEVP